MIFTRMLAGPMHFTPGLLSLTDRGGQRIQLIIAKQLAPCVAIYSPIQMAADLPVNYARYLDPIKFIRDGDYADWKTRAESFVIASRAAKHDDVLELALAPGGGQAIHYVATPRS